MQIPQRQNPKWTPKMDLKQGYNFKQFWNKSKGYLFITIGLERKDTNFTNNFPGPTLSTFNLLITIGKILGLLPIRGNCILSSELSFSKLFLVVCNIIASLLGALGLLGLYYVLKTSQGRSANDLALSVRVPLIYLGGSISYIILSTRTKNLFSLLSKWKEISNDVYFTAPDLSLRKETNWILIWLITSASIAHIVNQLHELQMFQQNDVDTLKRSENILTSFGQYHWAITMIILVLRTLAILSRVYIDSLIVVFSRALYFKFQILTVLANKCLDSVQISLIFVRVQGHSIWNQIRKDHFVLCKLVAATQCYLSPLIFLSFTMNIYFLCMQVSQGLQPYNNESLLLTIHSTISFFVLASRIVLITRFSSNVCVYSQQILNIVQRCPSYEYNAELERLERNLSGRPVALNGLGYFILNREFFIVLLSVCFTFEIVLLQTSSLNGSAQNTGSA